MNIMLWVFAANICLSAQYYTINLLLFQLSLMAIDNGVQWKRTPTQFALIIACVCKTRIDHIFLKISLEIT